MQETRLGFGYRSRLIALPGDKISLPALVEVEVAVDALLPDRLF
jgi:hypothetical protein